MTGIVRLGAMLSVASVTWKEWMAFRSHMVVSLFTGPLRFLTMVWIWRATGSGGAGQGGMSTESLVAYSGMAILVGYAIFDFADWNLQMLVRTGKYVNHLLQPMHHAWYALAQKFGHRALAVVVEAVPVWVLVSMFVGRPLLPQGGAWFAASMGIGFFLMFVVNYASGLVGFWLSRAEGVRRCTLLVRDTFGGAWIPLSFFPAAVQPILFATPYPWILYVPLSIATGHVRILGRAMEPSQAVGLQAAMLTISVIAVAGMDALARRRFLAAGG